MSKCDVHVNDLLHIFKENGNDKNSTEFESRSSVFTEETMKIQAEVEVGVEEGISYYDTMPSFSSIPFLFPPSSSFSQPTIFACHKEGDCIWLQVGRDRKEMSNSFIEQFIPADHAMFGRGMYSDGKTT